MATNSDPYCPIEEGRGEPDAAAVIAALVLTGETTLKDLEGLVPAGSPDFVLDRVDRLLPAQVWEELGWDARTRDSRAAATSERAGQGGAGGGVVEART